MPNIRSYLAKILEVFQAVKPNMCPEGIWHSKSNVYKMSYDFWRIAEQERNLNLVSQKMENLINTPYI